MRSDSESKRGHSTDPLGGKLHEEIANLSKPYREAVVLHYFAGKTYEQAAETLGCDVNRYTERLACARNELRKRLLARGVDVDSVALSLALGTRDSARELSPKFIATTCKAASLIASGKTLSGAVSQRIIAMTDRVLNMLYWQKVKTIASVFGGAVLLVGAVVALFFAFSDGPSHADGNPKLDAQMPAAQTGSARQAESLNPSPKGQTGG